MFWADMVEKKPRIVIIGAGMAGLSAARQLIQAGELAFDLVVLEASSKIGGRILTSEIGGNRVELGATWIHGMDGSPLYKIAQDIGATECKTPFERQDGFPGSPVVKAEGGLTIPPSIVCPIMDLYRKLLDHIRSKEKLDSSHTPLSIGAFVAHGLNAFLSHQNACHLEDALCDCLSNDGLLSWSNYTSPWTVKSLQVALFAMNEYMERVDTSANTLHDLDLRAEKEYKDYPGEHVTIPGGYISIVNEIASSLPQHLIHFGKMVHKIVWDRSSQSSGHPVALHCSDGSVYEADHVIVTVSLGVLKAGVMQDSTHAWDSPEGRHVCRSVDELLSQPGNASPSLFEPCLPPCKVEAISRLGYGLVNKVFLQLNTSVLSPSQLQQLNAHIQLVYKSCEEPKDGGAIPWWMRKTFSLSPIYEGSSVLLCWFAGSEALELESLSDEEIMSGVARTLAKFGMAGRSATVKMSLQKVRDSESSSGSDSEDSILRGESLSSSSSSDSEENFDDDEGGLPRSEEDYRSMFCGILRSRWGRNPLFHGSYSFVATGSSGDDIDMLAQPLPALISAEAGALNAETCASNAIGGAVNAREGAKAANEEALDEDEEFRCRRREVGCNDKLVKGNTAPLQLLFAGEATVRALYSTTHGAHLSGLREAQRLIKHYALEA